MNKNILILIILFFSVIGCDNHTMVPPKFFIGDFVAVKNSEDKSQGYIIDSSRGTTWSYHIMFLEGHRWYYEKDLILKHPSLLLNQKRDLNSSDEVNIKPEIELNNN